MLSKEERLIQQQQQPLHLREQLRSTRKTRMASPPRVIQTSRLNFTIHDCFGGNKCPSPAKTVPSMISTARFLPPATRKSFAKCFALWESRCSNCSLCTTASSTRNNCLVEKGRTTIPAPESCKRMELSSWSLPRAIAITGVE